MKSTTTLSAGRLLALTAALGGAVFLAACGGGSDSDAGTPRPTSPKPNPVPTAPTTTCSAAGIAASNASTAASTVCMLTSDGEIVVELDARAPLTTANFLSYVTSKFYDNTNFHRVVPNFVAQGGGYSAGFVEKKPTNPAIKLETNIPGLSNTKYTIAMARLASPVDSATSQFYFNSVDNSASLDYKDALNPGYAVFGRVISGTATVDKINAEPQLWTGADTPATEVLLYWAIKLK